MEGTNHLFEFQTDLLAHEVMKYMKEMEDGLLTVATRISRILVLSRVHINSSACFDDVLSIWGDPLRQCRNLLFLVCEFSSEKVKGRGSRVRNWSHSFFDANRGQRSDVRWFSFTRIGFHVDQSSTWSITHVLVDCSVLGSDHLQGLRTESKKRWTHDAKWDRTRWRRRWTPPSFDGPRSVSGCSMIKKTHYQEEEKEHQRNTLSTPRARGIMVCTTTLRKTSPTRIRKHHHFVSAKRWVSPNKLFSQNLLVVGVPKLGGHMHISGAFFSNGSLSSSKKSLLYPFTLPSNSPFPYTNFYSSSKILFFTNWYHVKVGA